MNEGNKPIPDADTCKAAEVLRNSNVELDTPTFWLLAGLIADVLRRDRAEQREEMCKVLCCMCQDRPSEFQDCDPKKSPFVHSVKLPECDCVTWVNCGASAIRSRDDK